MINNHKFLKYFAYGSNMHHYRLWERVPSCQFLDKVSLPGYTLNYHVRGMDGSGKCNIIPTGIKTDVVHGVVFKMCASELHRLDAAEGDGYAKKEILLKGRLGEHKTFAYIGKQEHLDESLKPFDWYKEIVIQGAQSQNLPEDYVRQLSYIETIKDPDPDRSKKHFHLLNLVVQNAPEID